MQGSGDYWILHLFVRESTFVYHEVQRTGGHDLKQPQNALNRYTLDLNLNQNLYQILDLYYFDCYHHHSHHFRHDSHYYCCRYCCCCCYWYYYYYHYYHYYYSYYYYY